MKKNKKYKKLKIMLTLIRRLFLIILFLGVCFRLTQDLSKQNSEENVYKEVETASNFTYMIYYGEVNDAVIEDAKQYDIVILHPKLGNLTREHVREIQESGTYVMGYLSIGEDLRTAGMTPEQMQNDIRFIGDGSGPRVSSSVMDSVELNDIDFMGEESPQGGGYASYYLDDNDYDGRPDFNPGFGCAYTNIGDPSWYVALNDMTLDGEAGSEGSAFKSVFDICEMYGFL